jgi:hypothetical protein
MRLLYINLKKELYMTKKLVMDAETRKKLMGYSVVTDSVVFTPEIEGVDEEFLPKFRLRAMSSDEQREIKFMYIETLEGNKPTPKERTRRDKVLNKVTQESIVGFENLIDISKEETIEWEAEKGKDFISTKLYDSLPALLKVLVMNEVMSINGLSI